ncbi:hypothetical protein BDW60DRAFT_200641 [Aspergillus nidulans var. acristatus]
MQRLWKTLEIPLVSCCMTDHEPFPDVLSQNRLPNHVDNLAGQTTATCKIEVYNGILSNSGSTEPIYICLSAESQEQPLSSITFDIDISDLQSSLHLSPIPVSYFDCHGHAHTMDQVLLPAIYQYYPSSLTQHYLSSYHHSRSNATARGYHAIADEYTSNKFFFNIVKEVCPSGTSQIQNPQGADRDGLHQTFYLMTMLQDSGSLTLETHAVSWSQQARLLYSQFYSSTKEIFAAGNIYPFTNSAIKSLALDPKLQKTWQLVGKGLSHDPVSLICTYLYTKQWCHHALQESSQKLFGTQEEYQVSKALLDQIHTNTIQDDNSLYYCYPMPTLVDWLRWNINKFCMGFEMVYSLKDHYFFSYSTRIIQQVGGCWHDWEGLGFQRMMKDYRYGWFLNKVDWVIIIFCQPYAWHMILNNPSIQAAYQAWYPQIQDICLDFLRDFLQQLSLYIFCKDIFLQVKQLLHPDHASYTLAGEVPLCHNSITKHQVAVKSVDTIFAWLWEWKDGHYNQKGWEDKPYCMVYQQSFEAINQISSKNRARDHWLLPYLHENGFMRKAKDTGQEVWWSNYNAGLYKHYRQWYGEHHPITGWGCANSTSQYIENAVKPEMDLVQLLDKEFYEKLQQMADQYSHNPDAAEWKRKASPTKFHFGITAGDEKLLKAKSWGMKTVARDLYMQMIQAMDEYKVLGHSGQITSDKESIVNQQDHLKTRVLELEPKMQDAVAAEQKQY